jgi:tetratricopeptide (TPR) repeat protein
MDAEAALELVDTLVATRTGEHLNNLQAMILRQVWQGQKYSEIATVYGYTEGHVKDVSAELWKRLSELIGAKITKSNLKTVIERYWNATGRILGSSSLSAEVGKEHIWWQTTRSQGGLDDRNFVGRENAIAHLQALAAQGAKIIVIQAQGGVGKTTLARRFLQQAFGTILEFAIAKEPQHITSVESWVEERLRQLQEEPGREFGISLDRLKRQLQSTRIGILIDNLEPVLDANGKFIPPHRRYVELLQVLAAPSVQALTLITSRDRLCESAVSVTHYLLPGLEATAWQQFWQISNLPPHPQILPSIHKAYAGNAKAMEIISRAVALDYAGDMTAYWQDYQSEPLAHRDLEDLVAGQLQRLEQLDPQAYQLLCRLGCFRYQAIPTVPTEALHTLLWNVPAQQQRRVIESLRNRSLVEYHRGEYWLHPVMQAAAIGRCRTSSDFQHTHRVAASFWTDRVATITTLTDALQALEAYYHCLETEDFEGAAVVILKRRPTKSLGVERLGRCFYQLGLYQPMKTAILQIIDKVKSGYHLSGLYSILGVLYRLSGQIHAAIAAHQHSGTIAAQTIAASDHHLQDLQVLNLKNWEQHALLNVGICQLELGELEQAFAIFEELRTSRRAQLIAEHLGTLYNPSVDVFSAFIHACLGRWEASYQLAQVLSEAMQQQPELATGHRFLFLGLTYKLLGISDRALTMLQGAIAYATEHHYPQIRANALSGLAALCRDQEDLATAYAHHQESVEILEKIGTYGDLAEAYFQQGLTYQKMQHYAQAQASFNRAMQLFNEMGAPKQVEKVQLSF